MLTYFEMLYYLFSPPSVLSFLSSSTQNARSATGNTQCSAMPNKIHDYYINEVHEYTFFMSMSVLLVALYHYTGVASVAV